MRIEQKLRILAARDGVSQTQLSKDLGITPVAVNRWFQGHAPPSIESYRVLSKYFDVPFGDLVDETVDIELVFRRSDEEQ